MSFVRIWFIRRDGGGDWGKAGGMVRVGCSGRRRPVFRYVNYVGVACINK